MLRSRVHRMDWGVMYRLVVDLVPSPVEGYQLKQSIEVGQRSNVEMREKEKDFDCCSR